MSANSLVSSQRMLSRSGVSCSSMHAKKVRSSFSRYVGMVSSCMYSLSGRTRYIPSRMFSSYVAMTSGVLSANSRMMVIVCSTLTSCSLMCLPLILDTYLVVVCVL